MGLTHCFENERGEITHCIPVYQLVRTLIPDWWWQQIPTDPSPWNEKVRPTDPSPWNERGMLPPPSPWKYIEHAQIADRIQHDLSTYALLYELAGTLSDGRGKEAIQGAVSSAVRDVQLPPGMVVSLNPQPIPPGKGEAKSQTARSKSK